MMSGRIPAGERPAGPRTGWARRVSGRAGPWPSARGDRLELVDEGAGLGQRQVLGPVDAVFVADQALQVGVLGPGDRVERLDLAGRRGLGGAAAGPSGPGRGAVGPGPRAVAVSGAVPGRVLAIMAVDGRRRGGLGLE